MFSLKSPFLFFSLSRLPILGPLSLTCLWFQENVGGWDDIFHEWTFQHAVKIPFNSFGDLLKELSFYLLFAIFHVHFLLFCCPLHENLFVDYFMCFK